MHWTAIEHKTPAQTLLRGESSLAFPWEFTQCSFSYWQAGRKRKVCRVSAPINSMTWRPFIACTLPASVEVDMVNRLFRKDSITLYIKEQPLLNGIRVACVILRERILKEVHAGKRNESRWLDPHMSRTLVRLFQLQPFRYSRCVVLASLRFGSAPWSVVVFDSAVVARSVSSLCLPTTMSFFVGLKPLLCGMLCVLWAVLFQFCVTIVPHICLSLSLHPTLSPLSLSLFLHPSLSLFSLSLLLPPSLCFCRWNAVITSCRPVWRQPRGRRP